MYSSAWAQPRVHSCQLAASSPESLRPAPSSTLQRGLRERLANPRQAAADARLGGPGSAGAPGPFGCAKRRHGGGRLCLAMEAKLRQLAHRRFGTVREAIEDTSPENCSGWTCREVNMKYRRTTKRTCTDPARDRSVQESAALGAPGVQNVERCGEGRSWRAFL